MFFVSVRVFCSNSNKIIEWFQKTYVFLLSHFVLCILSVAIILIASYGIVTSQNHMIMKFENLYQKVIFLSNFVHMTNDYKHFKIYFISPKSISNSDLYLFFHTFISSIHQVFFWYYGNFCDTKKRADESNYLI